MIRAGLLAMALAFASPLAAQQTTSQGSGVVLRGLDKTTGKISDITLNRGQSARFGRLTVTLQECRYPVNNKSGDAYAALLILEEGKDAPLFRGWMIASAPALSAVDHARYDVWVIRCTTS